MDLTRYRNCDNLHPILAYVTGSSWELEASPKENCMKLSASTRLFAAGLLLLTSSLRAQTTNATLVGGVTDPQSSAVVGATVVVKNMATGISRQATTSDLGTYRVFPLNPGTYEITASAPGFKSKAAPNVV